MSKTEVWDKYILPVIGALLVIQVAYWMSCDYKYLEHQIYNPEDGTIIEDTQAPPEIPVPEKKSSRLFQSQSFIGSG
nr:uncharacterized protein CTRU02_13481 [Colletotrichum truncatum]KAF6783244.1 hypothetical protein CTRU02_13481 [Colletotrichum truncatum]